jgi:nucleotide-binding universal stress UspA family protein
VRPCEDTAERRSEAVNGTIVCSVTDSDEGRSVLELGLELSERLGMRLVLAHVAERFAPTDVDRDSSGRVTMKGEQRGGEHFLTNLARECGVHHSVECRVAVGDPASLIGRIAAEEAADVILVGSRSRRWPARGLESRLARALRRETSVPILIAPPTTGRRRTAAAADDGG